MKRLNSNIAAALDMEMPDEPPVENSAPVVRVEPHEVVPLDNPHLPDMTDIEVKTLEAEKQMEEIITKGMGMFSELYEETPNIDPAKRNRHLEIVAMMMGETRSAVEFKANFQLKRKDQRMKESEFGGPKQGDTKISTANFFGSTADILKMVEDAKDGEVQ